MVQLFFNDVYTRCEHNCETTRKSRWIAESLIHDPISHMELCSPHGVTKDELLQVHSATYVEALETGSPRELAESQGFPWDSGLFSMVCASTGGMVAATEAAIRNGVGGTLSSGFHHARPSFGKGYCSINGLAVAARTALAHGLRSVLILDLDAHCGGGTSECVLGEDRIFHLDISVHPFDQYSPTPNSRLVMVDNGDDYLTFIEYELEMLTSQSRTFDLCIYNAGMDPFECCPVGGKDGISTHVLAKRERTVFAWCRDSHIPVAFTLAGGYIGGSLEKQDLVALHRLTLESAGCGPGFEAGRRP